MTPTVNSTEGLPPDLKLDSNALLYLNARAGWSPFVVVTPHGGPGGDGGDYGGNTPNTTTNGIQEAIESVAPGGGVVYLRPSGIYRVTAQIVVPSNVVVKSDMYGNECVAEGGANRPPAYVQSSFPGFALRLENVSSVKIDGIALLNSVGGGIQVSGSEGCYFDTFVQVSLGQIALQVDGLAHPCEKNEYRGYLEGDPAIKISTEGEVNHANDSLWFVTAEMPGGHIAPGHSVLYAPGGGYRHQFYNFYCRSTVAPGGQAVNLPAGGSAQLFFLGGEMYNRGGGNFLTLAGGGVVMRDVVVTYGNLAISAGSLTLLNSRLLAGMSVTVSGGTVSVDRFCEVDNAPWTISGGNLFLAPGGPLVPAIFGPGANYTPRALPQNAPVSGAWNPPVGRCLTAYYFPFASKAATDTYQVDISPDGGKTVQNVLPPTAVGVAGARLVISFIVPAGWSYRYTGAGTGPVISAGNAVRLSV